MDNRNLDKEKSQALIDEIKNDDEIIPEDVDPQDHDGVIPDEDIDPHAPTPEPEEPEVEEEPEPIDYKEKYSDSTREATALHFKNKKLNDTIAEADTLPQPTLEELKAYSLEQGTPYDELDDFSQNILKKTLVNEKKFEMIAEVSRTSKKIDEWAKAVDDFTGSPETVAKFPSLSDHEIEFKKYSMKEARRGMDMEDLVASFLFNVKDDSPTPKKPGKKTSMLLTSKGSGDGVPKPKKLNADDLRIIRTKDPRRYERLVKDGKAGLDLLDLD